MSAGQFRGARSEFARRSWPWARTLARLGTEPRRDRCLVVATSNLTQEYVKCLIPTLENRGLKFEVLDLSSRRRQFQLSMSEFRMLSADWGAAVSFDHSKWPTEAPEIRLPHGIRALPGWSHATRQLLLPSGEPRYAAIGLPSQASMDEMTERVPRID